jgi:membrane protease YdiL (CAAX protease family)
MNKNVIVYSLFSIVSLIALEQIVGFSYIPKQILRISLFLMIPLFGIYVIRKSNIRTEIKWDTPTLKELKIPLIASVVIFLGTIGGYFMLQFMFDAEQAVRGGEELGITPDNILIWGFYLSFINSLIEEFFFRGYIFYTLEKKSYTLAIIVSSILWSIYHVVIFVTIFHLYTVIFTIVGLFIIGVMLAYINKFGTSFINSWMVHIAADIGVVVVLLYMYTLV